MRHNVSELQLPLLGLTDKDHDIIEFSTRLDFFPFEALHLQEAGQAAVHSNPVNTRYSSLFEADDRILSGGWLASGLHGRHGSCCGCIYLRIEE